MNDDDDDNDDGEVIMIVVANVLEGESVGEWNMPSLGNLFSLQFMERSGGYLLI